MDALEQTALAVLSALRVIQDTKFQNLRVAVIGGAASQGSTTIPRDVTPRQVDVDFVVDTPDMGDEARLRQAILQVRPNDFNLPEADGKFYHRNVTRVDFFPSDFCAYLPAAAQRVHSIPHGTIPYITEADLIVFKIHCCGFRALEAKMRSDVGDVEGLLLLRRGTPLTLSSEQRVAVMDGLLDVLVRSNRPVSWWLRMLGPLGVDEEAAEEGAGEDSSPPYLTFFSCLSLFGFDVLELRWGLWTRQ